MPKESSPKTVRKIVLIIVAILFVLLIILGFSGYRYWNRSLEAKDPTNTEVVDITIPSGATRSDIARILEENNIIESAVVFNAHSRLNDVEGFQAGDYELSPAMSVEEITTLLTQASGGIDPNNIFKVLIPEGYMLEQIAEVIGQETEYSAEEFMALVQDEEYLEELSGDFSELLEETLKIDETRYKLEGYLYPATYEFEQGESLKSMVNKMVTRMNQEIQQYSEEIKASRFNIHELLTLASIIEREGVTTEDRHLISGVFHNRLDEGMPLQTDISILYAHNEHREDVYLKDLEIDSPYNSYANPGLIIGPVNSPSGEAIESALNPEESNYLYFLANLQTGEVYYAETYEEHLQLKAEHLDNVD